MGRAGAGGRFAVGCFGCVVCPDGKGYEAGTGIFFGREYGPYFRGDRLRHGASDDSEARLCADWFLAAVVHSLNHSVMKSLLFMSAGSVLHATGSKDIEKMGGLAKLMPWTAGFTLIGSMGLAALPLTGGFVGEWLMLQSFLTLVNSSEAQGLRLLGAVALVLVGLASALAVGCFVRLYGVVFLGRARSKVVEYAHEADWSMRLGMGLAAVLDCGAGRCARAGSGTVAAGSAKPAGFVA